MTDPYANLSPLEQEMMRRIDEQRQQNTSRLADMEAQRSGVFRRFREQQEAAAAKEARAAGTDWYSTAGQGAQMGYSMSGGNPYGALIGGIAGTAVGQGQAMGIRAKEHGVGLGSTIAAGAANYLAPGLGNLVARIPGVDKTGFGQAMTKVVEPTSYDFKPLTSGRALPALMGAGGAIGSGIRGKMQGSATGSAVSTTPNYVGAAQESSQLSNPSESFGSAYGASGDYGANYLGDKQLTMDSAQNPQGGQADIDAQLKRNNPWMR